MAAPFPFGWLPLSFRVSHLVVNRILWAWIVHQHCHKVTLGGKIKGSCSCYGVYSWRQGRETGHVCPVQILPLDCQAWPTHWVPKFKHISPTQHSKISQASHTSLFTLLMVTYTRTIIHAHYNQYFHASSVLRDTHTSMATHTHTHTHTHAQAWLHTHTNA